MPQLSDVEVEQLRTMGDLPAIDADCTPPHRRFDMLRRYGTPNPTLSMALEMDQAVGLALVAPFEPDLREEAVLT